MLKIKVMAKASSRRLHIEVVLIFVIIASMVIFLACAKPPESGNLNNKSTMHENNFSRACIDIEGKVFGDIIPYSAVSLNEIPNFNLSDVLATIRSSQPVRREFVNTTGGFRFSCLPSGEFAFVIPTTSYNGSIGSPLPYEFDCGNFSLRIVFQGGDSQYAIGAFWIKNVFAHNRSRCTENPFSCRLESGGLYRECQLDPE